MVVVARRVESLRGCLWGIEAPTFTPVLQIALTLVYV